MDKQKWCLFCDAPTNLEAYQCSNCGQRNFGNESRGSFLATGSQPVSDNSLICSECGQDLAAGQKFCANCGAEIQWTVDELRSAILDELKGSPKRFSARKKIFVGGWAFINFIYTVQLIEAAGTPVDRFRSLCITDNLNCGPSAQDKFNNSLGNLLIWNLIFLSVWLYFLNKNRKK